MIISSDLFAQVLYIPDNPDRKKILNFSFYTGINLTNFLGDTKNFGDSLNLLAGLNFEEKYRSFTVPVGMSFSIDPTSWLSFKTGVMYTPKGVKYKDMFEIDGHEFGAEVILCTNYIEIPALVELSAPLDGNSRIYLNGGIAPSYIVRSKIKTVVWVVGSSSNDFDQDEDSEDWKDVNKKDVGYLIGAGFKTNTNYWGIQYEKGTKSVSSTGWDFRNQTFTFVMGVYF